VLFVPEPMYDSSQLNSHHNTVRVAPLAVFPFTFQFKRSGVSSVAFYRAFLRCASPLLPATAALRCWICRCIAVRSHNSRLWLRIADFPNFYVYAILPNIEFPPGVAPPSVATWLGRMLR